MKDKELLRHITEWMKLQEQINMELLAQLDRSFRETFAGAKFPDEPWTGKRINGIVANGDSASLANYLNQLETFKKNTISRFKRQ